MEKLDWTGPLRAKLDATYFEKLVEFINQLYHSQKIVYPAEQNIFKAIEITALADTKVIIVGQDPYHQAGQAQGLAFSVPDTMIAPPSLRNILTELASDLGQERNHHDLTPWAEEGVLLLNTVLTVEDSKPNIHRGRIWEPLTDAIIEAASDDDRPKVFILWGRQAQDKARLINQHKHLIVKSAHPSPLSVYRGFWGSQPFSKTNQFLQTHGQKPIDWLR
ncbi:uracil-DNA glycosylase [Weissella oryzae SG25]|uniref:Uracil-DNA glycosylase n=1 Tax=Weissella oryzae (strain DSM 25784 / JCM 18191 / LMG 30913 / SG25) TaxID=1329250 RepID=A0A069CW97_WEIOS|nr:uracil-DNA glycosylase [Weissella oryzae]GAK31503.1 uracil-DNA glycosylase [Weissella oryzae SG25]